MLDEEELQQAEAAKTEDDSVSIFQTKIVLSLTKQRSYRMRKSMAEIVPNVEIDGKDCNECGN